MGDLVTLTPPILRLAALFGIGLSSSALRLALILCSASGDTLPLLLVICSKVTERIEVVVGGGGKGGGGDGGDAATSDCK